MSELTGSNHRCRAQFKCAQTILGQRFDRNGLNGLSHYYYYYYYYYILLLLLLLLLLLVICHRHTLICKRESAATAAPWRGGSSSVEGGWWGPHWGRSPPRTVSPGTPAWQTVVDKLNLNHFIHMRRCLMYTLKHFQRIWWTWISKSHDGWI